MLYEVITISTGVSIQIVAFEAGWAEVDNFANTIKTTKQNMSIRILIWLIKFVPIDVVAAVTAGYINPIRSLFKTPGRENKSAIFQADLNVSYSCGNP